MRAKAKMLAALYVSLISALMVSAAAQQRRTSGASRPNPTATVGERNKRTIEREAILSATRKPPAIARADASALAQVRKDYVRIQVLSNELMKAVAHGGALDYGQIAERAAEIGKSASRLKGRLALAESEESFPQQKDEAALRDAPLPEMISMLGERIQSFVSSPFFKNPRIINPAQMTAASRDLRSIIVISNWVKKQSKELRKGR